ncbi:chromobox protein [Tritrichomonas foetus]|uniref:Chromobox protein n=1 Tax=Tritrichomonas foetus TaxID=1144522 RepID=A0A1J4JQY7_9EUKA|nr:chromobox protein [Tritrichomonas foetus]|eukprot:OHT00832.1 chromobox protein [Tritrichomonas foetus]
MDEKKKVNSFGKNKNGKSHEDDDDEEFWEVEAILDKRIVSKNKVEYLVRWSGYECDDSFNSWVSEKDLNCKQLIEDYNQPKNTQVKKIISLYKNDENIYFYKTVLTNGIIVDYSSHYLRRNYPKLLQTYLEKCYRFLIENQVPSKKKKKSKGDNSSSESSHKFTNSGIIYI